MDLNLPDGNPPARRPRREVDYEAVFQAGVAPSAVITPDLIVADANDAYLAVTGRSREEVVGSALFDLLPPDPGDDRGPQGPETLLEVVRTGKLDVMDVLRYPLLDKQTGTFRARYFAPINVPVLDDRSGVAWILHHVEEVTSYVSGGRTTLPTQAERPAAPGYARSRDRLRRNRKLALRASHDRVVSTILQNAMLTALPEPDDLTLAARYIANTEADQVGGDWYDAAVLPSGGTMIAMGDVVGHDITAAASMGQLRGLLRALAWDRDEPPAAILARVERAMPGLKVDHVHYLTPGSTLILYTDGLVERRAQPHENGIARLSDTLRRYHQLALDELLDEVIRAVAGNAPEDDIAVLGVSVGHQQHRRCP